MICKRILFRQHDQLYQHGNLGDNIQVKIVQPGEEVSPEMLQDVALFVISAPLKYTSDYTGDAQPSVFEDSFIQTVSDYVNNGGTVVVCGLADYQDANSGLRTHPMSRQTIC